MEGGELEAAARLRRAGRRRQRGSGAGGVEAAARLCMGGRGGGCSAVLKGGEEAISRRDAFPV